MPDLTSDVIDDFVADSLHLEKSYDNQHSNADDAVAKPHPSTHQPKGLCIVFSYEKKKFTLIIFLEETKSFL